MVKLKHLFYKIGYENDFGKGVLFLVSRPDIEYDMSNLLSWYHKEGRILPWRSYWPNLTPAYHVFLSEFMLQQTGVSTVLPYFKNFLKQWPTIHKLAKASIDDVTAAWAGLGYYARARNMHKTAQIISREAGTFPQTLQELLKLPGIGPYTAGAILAFAFDAPSIVIDGNIERVVTRYFYIETSLPKLKLELPAFYEYIIPKTHRSDFPQALMDLGNEICTPISPDCKKCPLAKGCQSAKRENPGLLPNRPDIKSKPVRKGQIFIIRSKTKIQGREKYLVYRRDAKGLLGGLIAFPSQGWDEKEQIFDKTWRPLNIKWMEIKPTIKHVFSHFNAEVQVFTNDIDKPDDCELLEEISPHIKNNRGKIQEVKWMSDNELHLPKLMQKALKLVQSQS